MNSTALAPITFEYVPHFYSLILLRWYRSEQLACAFPIGGLGVGHLQLNADGTFGRGSYDNNYQTQAPVTTGNGLVLWCRTADGRTVCRQLCAPVREQPFPLTAVTQTRLAGHWPFVEVRYEDDTLPVRASLQAWTPVIPGDADDSNIPVALFELTLTNLIGQPVEVGAAMSWNNGAESNLPSPTEKITRHERWEKDGLCGLDVRGEGYSFILATFSQSDADTSTLDRWVLPSWTSDTSLEPWDQTWARFAVAGRFETSRSVPLGGAGLAVCQTLRMLAEETVTVRFLLAWHFPTLKDPKNNDLGVHYARRYADAEAVACDVARRYNTLLARTVGWQAPLYQDDRLPDWLKEHLPNALYTYSRDSLWIADSRFSHMESMYGCPINETIVCRFYGAIATLLFWPDLEKNTLRQYVAHQGPDGAIPFIFGGKCGFDEPNWEVQKSLDSSEFVALVYRYVQYTGDDGFAAEVYPAVQKAIDYAATLDTDGDGLVNEVSGQYFDCWQFYGHSSYVSSVWLLALRAACALAERLRHADDVARYATMLERGQRRFEELSWTGTHYRIYRDDTTGRQNDACLVSQTIGEWFAATCGLKGVLPDDHVTAALERVIARNAPLSPLGIVNSSAANGSGPDMTGFNGFSCTITIGDTYAFADHLIRRGQREQGLLLAERMVRAVTEVARSPWGQTWNCSARDGRMLLMTDYYSNLVVWTLFQSLTGQRQVSDSNQAD